jgi:hypothetical protein
MANEQNLVSLGYAAQILQVSPTDVGLAAERAGVAPVFRLNGVPYYNEADLRLLRRPLARQAYKARK